jgi:hypothetical protein
MVAVRRQADSVCYVALHEPFDQTRAADLELRQVCDRDGVLLLEVKSGDYTDYILYARDLAGLHQVATDVGSFSFRGGYGYVRVGQDRTIAQGRFEKIQLEAPGFDPTADFILNGQPVSLAELNDSSASQ